MRQYETAIRIAQVHHLADERKYKKALTVIETLDMRQVRNVSDLKVFAEVFTRTEQFEAAKATYLRIYKKSRTRRILYRLIYLAIRTNELEDAESFYKEFIKMNPNNRDALILRYRIDKASGVPIGQLIDILKTLKDEEYVEEWAYELAKLYQQAGRYVECREECEDIKLWFGQGEIVERAKLLLEHIDEKNPMPFMDDKDFTEKREKPNPEDTGSLPDINEYLHSDNEYEMKLLKKVDPAKFEETMVENMAEEISDAGADDIYARAALEGEESIPDAPPVKEETPVTEAVEEAAPENAPEPAKADDFEDDYDETLLEDNEGALPKMAMDGIQKLSGLLFGGKKEEDKDSDSQQSKQNPQEDDDLIVLETPDAQATDAQTQDAKTPDKDVYSQINPDDYPRISQSGTGITQDLAAEISAIYEAEQNEQFKEKAVTVMSELPNKTNEVVERMTEEAAKTPTKEYIPMEARAAREVPMDNNDMAKTMVIPTLDVPDTMQVEDTKVVQPDILEAGMQPGGQPDTSEELSAEALLMEALEAEVQAVEARATASPEQAAAASAQPQAVPNQAAALQQMMQAGQGAVPNQAAALQQMMQAGQGAVPNQAAALQQMMQAGQGAVPNQAAALQQMMQAGQGAVPNQAAALQQMMQAGQGAAPNQAEALQQTMQAGQGAAPNQAAALQQMMQAGQGAVPNQAAAPEQVVQTPQASAPNQEVAPGQPVQTPQTAMPEQPTPNQKAAPEQARQEASAGQEQVAAAVEETSSPDPMISESATGEILLEKDLPTTRALHRSFADILILIGGELDPSHFVLMGDGDERILGISKKIATVMRETGYLSTGRIARIDAEQLNQMDLVQFKSQLKGNCLLVTRAADLLFPAITRIFSIMDEYYGDFAVILSDEGATLDQLFRFVPALARRFKYIIDISQYTEQDYR